MQMKPNTFDVPAYKFGLIFLDDTIIPWENVDGLCIEEILKILGKQGQAFSFICYVLEWEEKIPLITNYFFVKRQKISITQHINRLYTLQFPSDISTNISSQPIDKVIEEDCMTRYMNLDKTSQKIFKCFFERYQDENHEATLKRIRKLEEK